MGGFGFLKSTQRYSNLHELHKLQVCVLFNTSIKYDEVPRHISKHTISKLVTVYFLGKWKQETTDE
jgi:hypothetical protein